MAKKSTTPRADREQAEFEKWHKETPVIKVLNADIPRLRCSKCGARPMYRITTYAFTRGPGDILCHCECNGRVFWLEVTDWCDVEKSHEATILV